MKWLSKFLIFLGLKKKPDKYPPRPEIKEFDATHHKLLQEAYEFFLEELGLTSLKNNFKHVKHINNDDWEKFNFDPNSNGQCNYFKNKHEINITIRSTGTIWGSLEILAHEMVHAKQFLTGEINVSDEGCYFHGEPYESLPWNARPIEGEARSQQYPLVLKFIHHMDKNYKNWLSPKFNSAWDEEIL